LLVQWENVPQLAKERGISPEMAGRQARYQFFARLMQQYDIPLLATAHHADDNLETVLLRLTGGSAATGLSGIAPMQPFVSGSLVRPLLQATRQEILTYCEQHGLDYVTDSTNADTAYLRNRVRAELTPALQHLTPHPQRQLLRSCAMLREDDQYLYSQARQALAAAKTPQGSLLLSVLQQTPLPLLRRLLLSEIYEHATSDCRVQSAHVDALLHLVTCRHGRADLPAGLCAIADGQTLTLAPAASTPPLPAFEPLPLQQGCFPFPERGFTLTVTRLGADAPLPDSVHKISKNPQNVYNTFIRDTLSFDTIVQDAYFRPRAAGDLLLLRGMHRKVRKLQNQAGIPPALRHRLPVLCDERGILWVPFVGVRDDFPVVPPESAEYLLTLSVDAPLISCL
jgi:tRNA(Ile)-lysidine synthase